jgi:hypothetical protein
MPEIPAPTIRTSKCSIDCEAEAARVVAMTLMSPVLFPGLAACAQDVYNGHHQACNAPDQPAEITALNPTGARSVKSSRCKA